MGACTASVGRTAPHAFDEPVRA